MNKYATSNAVMDIQRPTMPPPTNVVPSQPPQQPAPNGGTEPPLPPQPPQMPEAKPSRRKGPIIAIILVVLVVLALIAGAVVFYLQSQKKTEEPTAQTSTETPIEDDGYIDPNDVDATVQKIDAALTNLNDSADFGADDLNDSTLGL